MRNKSGQLPSAFRLPILFGLFLIFFVALSPVFAATSETIAFQSKLVNSDGTNIPNNTYNFRFQMFNVASGGTVQWSEDRAVGVVDGVVSVDLGAVTPFDPDLFNNSSLYLQVCFDANGTDADSSDVNCGLGSHRYEEVFSTRKPITAVPWAFSAKYLTDSLGNSYSYASFFLQGGNGFGGTGVIGTNDNYGLQFITNANVGMTLDALGRLGIGKEPTVTFDVLGQAQITNSTTTTGVFNGFVSEFTTNPSTDTVNRQVNFSVASYKTGGFNSSELTSLAATAFNSGSGSLALSRGFWFVGGALSTGEIGNMVVADLQAWGTGTGQVVNSTGLRIQDMGLGSTVASSIVKGIDIMASTSAVDAYKYGIYIGNQSGAYANWAIYTDGPAISRFGGNVTTEAMLGVLESGSSPLYYTYFQGGDQVGNITYTLPTSSTNGVLTNTGGILSWSAGGSGNAFVQDGNSFGELAVLGTTDDYGISVITNSIERVAISNSGDITLSNQLRLGNYAVNPTGIGAGAMIFNSTSNTFQCYDGSTWGSCAGAASGTLFSETGTIASGSYINLAHNQNSNDLITNGWVYDGSKWIEIDSIPKMGVSIDDPMLIGYYKMEESSGTLDNAEGTAGNDLIVKNTPTYQATGKISKAITLDGVNDYFCSSVNGTTCADVDAFDMGTGSFSVGGWFKHGSAGASGNKAITKYSNVASVDTGNGNDGSITIGADTNINVTNSISGRTCSDGGDAVSYSVTALTANTATIESTPASGCLNVGDEVLLINLHGTSTASANVGNYETLRILSVSSNVVTFSSNKVNSYGDTGGSDTNIGLGTTNQTVVLQRVPNYVNVTLNNSGTDFYTDAYVNPNGAVNNGAGEGGILFFRATGTVTVNSGTVLNANNRGYAGGAGAPGPNMNNGYSGVGTNANSAQNAGANTGGGGAGIYNGNRGGGGGSYGSTGGGTGGTTYGNATIDKLYFGSGGGGGSSYSDGSGSGSGGAGGIGGGMIFVAGGTISISGAAQAIGSAGNSGITHGSGGGGGSGGSIKLVGNIVNIGTALVNAGGGGGGTGYSGANGYSGGNGRVAIEYVTSYTGTSSPTLTATQKSSNSGGYKLYLNASGNYVFGIDDDHLSFPEDSATTSASYADGNWHHVVAVKDGVSSIKVYVDGQEVASDYVLSSILAPSNGSPLYFGIDYDAIVSPWGGSMDNVFVYSRALSAGEVQQLYQDNSSYSIEQVDANNVRLYNNSGQSQLLKLNAISGGTSGTGSGDITGIGSMSSGNAFADLTADNQWLGLGSSAGRIEFDDLTIDEINFLDANIGIGTATPLAKLDIKGSITEAVLSSEMISNAADRDFSSSTGNWSGTNWTISTARANHTAGANAYTLSNSALTGAPVAGRTYRIVFTMNSNVAGGQVMVTFGGTSNANTTFKDWTGGSATNQSVVITATNAGPLSFTPDATWAGYIDNVSIVEVTPTSALFALTNADGSVGTEMRSGGDQDFKNVFIGIRSGQVNSQGYQNVALGGEALRSNVSGIDNTAIGYATLQQNVSGSTNIAIGSSAMVKNTIGYENVAIGKNALYSNTYGHDNIAIGDSALYNSNVTSVNIAIGSNALYASTFGYDNIAIGDGAMQNLTTGGGNLALGYRAGNNITTGNNNLSLGYQAGAGHSTGNRNIAIGYQSQVYDITASNQLSIANMIYGTDLDGTWANATANGKIGLGTRTPGTTLHVSNVDATTNTQRELQRIERLTSGTAAAGIGAYTSTYLEDAAGVSVEAGRAGFVLRTATTGDAAAGEFVVSVERETFSHMIEALSVYADGASKWMCGNTVRDYGQDCFGWTIGSGNSAKFQFDGTDRLAWDFSGTTLSTVTPNGTNMKFNTLGSGNTIAFDQGNNGNDLYIDGSGNIGIGTSSPGTRLNLDNSTADAIFRISTGASGTFDPIIQLTGQAGIAAEGLTVRYDNDVGDTYFNNVLGVANAFHFQVAGSEKFTIQSDGDIAAAAGVIVGTQLYGPGSATQYGSLTINGTKGGWSGINFQNGATNHGTFMTLNNTQGYYNTTDNGWSWQWSSGSLSVGTVPLARLGGNVNSRVRINDTGCQASWASSCDVNNNGYIDYADALLSDQNLKTVSKPLTDVMDKIMSLKSVYYSWNDKYAATGLPIHGPQEIGLIAQDVQKLFPELVFNEGGDDNYLRMDYQKFTAVLLTGIQEQQGQINDLAARLSNGGGSIIDPVRFKDTSYIRAASTSLPQVNTFVNYTGAPIVSQVGALKVVYPVAQFNANSDDSSYLGVVVGLEKQDTLYNEQSNPYMVARLGEEYLWVEAGDGTDIMIGDSISISTTISGYGSRNQVKTMATALEPIDWDMVTETYSGKKVKKILVAIKNEAQEALIASAGESGVWTQVGQDTIQTPFKVVANSVFSTTADFNVLKTRTLNVNEAFLVDDEGNVSANSVFTTALSTPLIKGVAGGITIDLMNDENFTVKVGGAPAIEASVKGVTINNLVVGKEQAGKVTLTAGQKEIVVTSTLVHESSVVITSPNVPIATAVQTYEGYFVAKIDAVQTEDIQLGWYVVNVTQE